MSKLKCDGCKGDYDAEDMIIQDMDTIYCLSCDYENSAKQDAKTDNE